MDERLFGCLNVSECATGTPTFFRFVTCPPYPARPAPLPRPQDILLWKSSNNDSRWVSGTERSNIKTGRRHMPQDHFPTPSDTKSTNGKVKHDPPKNKAHKANNNFKILWRALSVGNWHIGTRHLDNIPQTIPCWAASRGGWIWLASAVCTKIRSYQAHFSWFGIQNSVRMDTFQSISKPISLLHVLMSTHIDFWGCPFEI